MPVVLKDWRLLGPPQSLSRGFQDQYYNYTKMLFVFSLFDTCTDGAKLVMGFIAVYAGALARMVVAPKCRNHCILYHHQLLERSSRGRNQFYLRMSLKQLKLLIIISTNEYTSFKHFV